jgi:hypothetical protein
MAMGAARTVMTTASVSFPVATMTGHRRSRPRLRRLHHHPLLRLRPPTRPMTQPTTLARAPVVMTARKPAMTTALTTALTTAEVRPALPAARGRATGVPAGSDNPPLLRARG